MSDNKKRAGEYLAKAEELEKQASRSGATRAELIHLAQQYRRLADEIEANFSLPETILFNPPDGRLGTA